MVQWCRLLHMLPNVHAGSWCKSAILTLLCTRPAISQPIVLQDDRSVNADRSLSQYACTAGHSSSALSLHSVSHCMRESDSDSKSCCVSILNTVGCGTIGCCANGWSRLKAPGKAGVVPTQLWQPLWAQLSNHTVWHVAVKLYAMHWTCHCNSYDNPICVCTCMYKLALWHQELPGFRCCATTEA